MFVSKSSRGGDGIVYDPRPDLAYDSIDWIRLLATAKLKNVPLAHELKAFRCGGLRLQRDSRGYILTPELEQSRSVHWKSQADYERDRDKYLMPFRDEIISLLDDLSG